MDFLDYLSTNWDHVLELAIGHAIVVAISLVIAVVIAVPLGVLVYRRERAAKACRVWRGPTGSSSRAITSSGSTKARSTRRPTGASGATRARCSRPTGAPRRST